MFTFFSFVSCGDEIELSQPVDLGAGVGPVPDLLRLAEARYIDREREKRFWRAAISAAQNGEGRRRKEEVKTKLEKGEYELSLIHI